MVIRAPSFIIYTPDTCYMEATSPKEMVEEDDLFMDRSNPGCTCAKEYNIVALIIEGSMMKTLC